MLKRPDRLALASDRNEECEDIFWNKGNPQYDQKITDHETLTIYLFVLFFPTTPLSYFFFLFY
jgi:hypothetical protein